MLERRLERPNVRPLLIAIEQGLCTLECDVGEAEPMQRTLRSAPIEALTVGMTIRLRYLQQEVIDGPFYYAFAIHDLDGTLLVGNYRNNVPNDAPVDPTTFFEPFEFDAVDGLCGTERWEDEGGMFVQDPCPQNRTPLGVEVSDGARSTTIIDDSAETFAGYEFNIHASFVELLDVTGTCGVDGDRISAYIFAVD